MQQHPAQMLSAACRSARLAIGRPTVAPYARRELRNKADMLENEAKTHNPKSRDGDWSNGFIGGVLSFGFSFIVINCMQPSKAIHIQTMSNQSSRTIKPTETI